MMTRIASHVDRVDLLFWADAVAEFSRVDLVAHGHCHPAIRLGCLDWKFEQVAVILTTGRHCDSTGS